MDEKRLILQAKQGNEQAFAQLYELFFDKIFRFVFFRINDKEAAEDLTEETFIKAWTKISNVNEESFSGWLYQIAKNKVIDHYRQRKTTVNIEDIANILETEYDLPEQTNALFDSKLLLELIRELPPDQQIIIKLKFIEDLDNAEISELISKSEGSIRVAQHRAIERLQELYKQRDKNRKNPDNQQNIPNPPNN